jgi:gamma-glutamyltranspeptidase/glutathione hydrolase
MTLPQRGGRVPATALLLSALVLVPLQSQPGGPSGVTGLREPAWSPDGDRLAVVFLDRVWILAPNGRDAKAVTSDVTVIQRDPEWAGDGARLAYAMDTGSGFDIYVSRVKGGVPERVTSASGDERSPSWAPDGRIVYAQRDTDAGQWDLYAVAQTADGTWEIPVRLTDSPDNEMQPRVSPDGTHLAFASDRDSDEGDVDLWVTRMPGRGEPMVSADREASATENESASASSRRRRSGPVRVLQGRGLDGYPSWSPDGTRLAYYGVREGIGSTWVVSVDPVPSSEAPTGRVPRERPRTAPVLASRHGGAVAWSPDGRTLAIGEIPDPEPTYNGNPHRDLTDGPPVFGLGRAYQLWTVPAPRPVDEGGRPLTPAIAHTRDAYTAAFDRVWTTLKRLYYGSGDAAAQWDALRAKYRPQAAQARHEDALEDVTDRLVAEQPLVKPAVVSSRAVVVSGHPLASEAGRLALEKGGNVVDAMIAVSFALGVVEPEASGIGGDGQAVLFLNGMSEPTVVEYKDQTPIRATLDNQKIFRNGRLVGDGPAAANIPGVVAGLDYLYKHYGSGRVKWAELIEPAIRYAEEGFTLDAALPSSIAEGRQFLQKYPEAARIFLPGGKVPQPGDTFVNKDYAETLRIIAKDGAEAFYRGSIARRIADDMEANGGIITYEDLAQYHAVERKPVMGRYHGHLLYTGGPPVGSGVSLLEAFQVFNNYQPDAGATPATDADYWHYMIESWKVRDPIRRIADPAHWPVEYEAHLEPSHAAELFRKIEAGKASRLPENEDEERGGPGGERIGRGTTAFVIVDAEGNMIAVTQTLSTWGGTFYVSKGLGFLYNNHLRSSRTERGAYGQLLPLMRSNTSSVPTLVFREDGDRRTPRLAVGVAGNAWIPASAYSIITGVIDGGLPMQRAIEAPRFLVSRDPADPLGNGARIEIEDRFPRSVLENLMGRGHRFQKIGRKGEVRYGYASAALVDPINRRVEGGSEPRRSHMAVAVGGTASTTQ